jgi:hypothetical protein
LGIRAHLIPPENLIRTDLYLKSRVRDKERTHFFYPLLRAWDAIAFDRYDISDAQSAADDLNRASYDGSYSIKLADPQVAIIDALADAVGIQRQKGQTQIPIPERLRGQRYWQWRTSPEYAQECDQRIARARMRQGK